jgi:hypothetical protein
MTSQRIHPGDGDLEDLRAFLRQHDGFLQALVTILGHAYGAESHEVFLLTRAAVHDRWGELGPAEEPVRLVETSLQMARTARTLGTHGANARHRPQAAQPPGARSVLAARGFDPPWRHPDPWRLLAADEARPLRALAHLDPLSRDLAVLRWLGVPDARTTSELGLSEGELPARRREAMRQWSVVVTAATDGGPEAAG